MLTTLTASYGGGAFAYRGTAALYDSTISGNRAVRDPANLHWARTTPARDCSPTTAVISAARRSRRQLHRRHRGRFATHGSLSSPTARISGNTATKKRRRDFHHSACHLTIVSCTIADNTVCGRRRHLCRRFSSIRSGIHPAKSIVAEQFRFLRIRRYCFVAIRDQIAGPTISSLTRADGRCRRHAAHRSAAVAARVQWRPDADARRSPRAARRGIRGIQRFRSVDRSARPAARSGCVSDMALTNAPPISPGAVAKSYFAVGRDCHDDLACVRRISTTTAR